MHYEQVPGRLSTGSSGDPSQEGSGGARTNPGSPDHWGQAQGGGSLLLTPAAATEAPKIAAAIVAAVTQSSGSRPTESSGPAWHEPVRNMSQGYSAVASSAEISSPSQRRGAPVILTPNAKVERSITPPVQDYDWGDDWGGEDESWEAAAREERQKKARDYLRKADTVHDLQKAINIARREGLEAEVAIAERKLQRLHQEPPSFPQLQNNNGNPSQWAPRSPSGNKGEGRDVPKKRVAPARISTGSGESPTPSEQDEPEYQAASSPMAPPLVSITPLLLAAVEAWVPLILDGQGGAGSEWAKAKAQVRNRIQPLVRNPELEEVSLVAIFAQAWGYHPRLAGRLEKATGGDSHFWACFEARAILPNLEIPLAPRPSLATVLKAASPQGLRRRCPTALRGVKAKLLGLQAALFEAGCGFLCDHLMASQEVEGLQTEISELRKVILAKDEEIAQLKAEKDASTSQA